jgi:hypothetical protein
MEQVSYSYGMYSGLTIPLKTRQLYGEEGLTGTWDNRQRTTAEEENPETYSGFKNTRGLWV